MAKVPTRGPNDALMELMAEDVVVVWARNGRRNGPKRLCG
jgi:hypothetical protein